MGDDDHDIRDRSPLVFIENYKDRKRIKFPANSSLSYIVKCVEDAFPDILQNERVSQLYIRNKDEEYVELYEPPPPDIQELRVADYGIK